MPHTSTSAAGEAFGKLALSYDSDFDTLPASQRLRRIIWEIWLRHFPRGSQLLELNCGTGTDALALAGQGMRVHATDASAQMLDRLREKVSHSAFADRITSQQVPFAELSSLDGRLFDGVYSNMGGLNCEPDMTRVAHDLHALIKPGGCFVGTFLGDWAIWEMAAFIARGNIRAAFRRRTKEGIPANVAGTLVQTYYYSPRAIAKAFGSDFAVLGLHGLNIFTPPPTSQQAYRRFAGAMRVCERIDDRLMNVAPFNHVGDHYVIVLQKRV
jgi:SAM-dependent methyltransferase